MALLNLKETNAFRILYKPDKLSPELFPNFDQIRGDEKHSSPSDKESRKDILVFTECEEIQVYYSGGAAAFNEKGLISVLERFLSNTMREIITEQVVAVATNTRKHQRVQLVLRADIAYFLILIPVAIRMGVATTHARGGMITILNVN
ncbi:hypothetical protein LZ32DRAFT_659382 [Colletotrichum eremochloae]|nr:hypothetical protein LZ32DRAFT_659382 [Colletotrichum eremochloae]